MPSFCQTGMQTQRMKDCDDRRKQTVKSFNWRSFSPLSALLHLFPFPFSNYENFNLLYMDVFSSFLKHQTESYPFDYFRSSAPLGELRAVSYLVVVEKQISLDDTSASFRSAFGMQTYVSH